MLLAIFSQTHSHTLTIRMKTTIGSETHEKDSLARTPYRWEYNNKKGEKKKENKTQTKQKVFIKQEINVHFIGKSPFSIEIAVYSTMQPKHYYIPIFNLPTEPKYGNRKKEA